MMVHISKQPRKTLWLRVRTVPLMHPLPPSSPQYWATLERKQKNIWSFSPWNVASRSRQMSYELTGCIDKRLFWLASPCIFYSGSDPEVSHTDEEHHDTSVYNRRLTIANLALLMPVSPLWDRTPRWRREFHEFWPVVIERQLRPWHPGPERATKSKNHDKENNRPEVPAARLDLRRQSSVLTAAGIVWVERFH